MGSTFRFLAIDDEHKALLAWFDALPSPPERFPSPRGMSLYFRSFGSLATTADGIDAGASPVVNVFWPRRQRGALWTAGEVHFLSTPLRARFPQLAAVSRKFGSWLAEHELVFSRRRMPACDRRYFLEGSLQNYDSEIFAFPKAAAALHAGQYFVADDDTDAMLDRVCQKLRLRGVPCQAE